MNPSYPGAFLLDPLELPALAIYLNEMRWLQTGESVQSAERAGEGNMNCVVRVRTSESTFILKQARPWVEKYPHIPASWDRALTEAAFYREIKQSAFIRSHVPDLLAFDSDERILMLEDLGQSTDLTWLYNSQGQVIPEADLAALIQFLVTLHVDFRDQALASFFQNQPMRELNHEHIFSFPLSRSDDHNLNAITPGLAALAKQLQSNAKYAATVAELGRRYLDASQGTCLLHGDYFPGSWLNARGRVYVIDPEFGFYGPPEWDLGVMLAHFHLAGQPAELMAEILKRYQATAPLNPKLACAFAGVEIMRRLIGVAQLPLSCGLDRKRELLDISVSLVLKGSAS